MIKKIVFLGAGNVATNLALAFKDKSFDIVQIFSRTEKSASGLAKKTGSSFTIKASNIIKDADVYIIALSDNVLDSVLRDAGFSNQLLVHTSGSLSMDVLKKYSSKYGVFYPLQTFSKSQPVDLNNVPVCIEGSDKNVEAVLSGLAKCISGAVHTIDSETRSHIHLAAVFACNFSNHMYSVAEDILIKKNMSFDILKPLIEETARKITLQNPREAQTGPAVRDDKNIMEKHLKMLWGAPLYENIYRFVSESILKSRNQ
ncbi:MAG: DUF2520 domain-containing protein [Bacteroidia bacterium]|nr:DUF2520 domain-containing protein [Bacteroidia bacterium]